MKKRVLLLVSGLCIALMAGGCSTKNNLIGNNNTGKTAAASPTPTGAATAITEAVNDVVREKYNVDDYVKLGNYKGVEVTVTPLKVTEEDIDVAIQQDMESKSATLKEVTDRAVKMGDTVNIDYQGLKDGVAFDGGSATGSDLLIGSGSFIPGFEDQIVGAKKGDKLELNVTFPENYSSTDLAGKAVVFKVTVNKIQEYEVTDATVKDKTDYDTVAAYRTGISDKLTKQNEETMKSNKEKAAYDAVLKNSEVKSIPQTLMDYYAKDIKVYISNLAAQYSMTFDDYLSATGSTEDQFNEKAQEYAKSMAQRELILNAIIKAENITLSDDEYNKMVSEYAANYGYSSSEEFLKASDESVLKEEFLYQKATDYIVSNSIEK